MPLGGRTASFQQSLKEAEIWENALPSSSLPALCPLKKFLGHCEGKGQL